MKAMIRKYLKDYLPSDDTEWFKLVDSKRTLPDQIETAVLSLDFNGRMHGHQRRVGGARLKKYAQAMLSQHHIDLIKKALRSKNFHAVYLVFKEETKHHYMVSTLTAYDVTQRICHVYGIEPEFVYLHTGTTEGARNLNIKTGGKEYLQSKEVPAWLSSSLAPADIENFLCIYKDEFRLSTGKHKSICPPKKIKNSPC
jgi:hypothetical protein